MMDLSELESLANDMISIATEANVKRTAFKGREDRRDLEEQSLGEVLGAGKCLQLLVDRYPAEMKVITAPPGP